MGQAQRVNCDEALIKLMDGNKRFVDAMVSHPNQNAEHRVLLGNGQAPFAAVLACADSRVPPEVLFDQGLGDLFVVRVAGNIINDQLLGSLEYAAAHLHTPLIMVMGHTSCGAIGAVAQGAELEGHMSSLVPAIQPAVDKVRGMEGDLTDNAAREIARMTADQLRTSDPVLAPMVADGKLKVVAGFYDLESGIIKLL
ncbi:MAG: carbonic anhydrase [Desulfobulbaceae bacterium]|jgi:carbonic anhydrase|nr:carbonic anhydrase [Desulfobulbaceae bacterium]